MDCTTKGNGDLYGVGVRTGLYLQWAAGFLLRNWNGSWKTISAVRVTNNAICYAIIVTMIIGQAEGSALSLDFLLVYYLTIALFYSESYNLLKKRDAAGNEQGYLLRPDFPLVAQNFLCALISVFGVWFWIQGVYHVELPTCPAKAACLGLFPLMSTPWRRFAAAMSAITGILFVAFFAVHLMDLLPGLNKGPVRRVNQIGIRLARIFQFASARRIDYDPSHSQYTYRIKTSSTQSILRPKLRKAPTSFSGFIKFTHWAIINLLGPLIAIVSVERMLQANHLTTESIATSSGQMIALFTGIASIFVAIADIVRGSWAQQRKDLAEEFLELQAHERSRPLDAKETRTLLRQLLVSEGQRDPAFLEEIIQTSASDIMSTPKPLVENDELESSPDSASKLSNAIRQPQFVTTLLKRHDIEVNCRDPASRQTPLGYVAQKGDLSMLKLLLSHKDIEVDARNKYRQTPFLEAAANGHVEIMEDLSKHGADPNCRDQNGYTPLTWAVLSGHDPVIKILLAMSEVNPNLVDENGQQPLCWASKKGNKTAVRLLLEHRGKAEIEHKDRHGRTSLCWASMAGQMDVVKILAEEGANSFPRDISERTPLIWAAMRGHLNVVKYLCAQASQRDPLQIDARDIDSRTPLSWAVRNNHEQIVKVLLGHGSDIKSRDSEGQIPLFIAAQNCNVKICKLLVGRNRVYVEDDYGG
ncbi:hypothetical protein N7481_012612 [Penicillium waksmanii]|uniref:uncharacterized protein n=1 Tax=Penicillium waksmanii TaxID=69791 RepID=UPI002548FA44|nr:uncharacterized protein N7481_012612 [Penicillium waksmanii]KAJ5965898.1 hypothetical protein N7481_012612 [Penicillium waksmanii]